MFKIFCLSTSEEDTILFFIERLMLNEILGTTKQGSKNRDPGEPRNPFWKHIFFHSGSQTGI